MAQPTMDKSTQRLVLAWMVREVRSGAFIEDGTGEPQPTQLAEAASAAFDSDHWLDDETGLIWDLALDAYEDA